MRRLLPPVALLVAVTLCSCLGQRRLRIGSKNFTEQRLLADMLARLCQREGIPVERVRPCEDTVQCLEAIKQGELDLYVEYTGTGLVMMGQNPVRDPGRARALASRLFEPLGLTWMDPLGFDNGYVVLVSKRLAETRGLQRISDLGEIEGGVRIGGHADFLWRPVDGLVPLKRRYALELRGKPRGFEDKPDMYQALVDGEIDVAVGFATDGTIERLGLVVLEDDLNFFPAYEAAPLIRKDALERHPGLPGVFSALGQHLSSRTMRRLNHRVEFEGFDCAQVALHFLQEKGLMPPEEKKRELLPPVVLAIGPLADLEGSPARVQFALRKVFAGRRLKIRRTADPGAAVRRGRARVALVGAESFFGRELSGRRRRPRQPELQAFAALGHREVHWITRGGDPRSLAGTTQVGVGPPDGASHRLGRILRASLGPRGRFRLVPGEWEQQLGDLLKGRLGALLVMAPAGNSKILSWFRRHDLGLLPVSGWQAGPNAFRFPFVRPARIAGGTYPGQEEPVETVATQLVLAGLAPEDTAVADMGPVSALFSRIGPLSPATIRTLLSELETAETLDPALPQPEMLEDRRPLHATGRINPSPGSSVLNALVLVILMLLIHLALRHRRRAP